MEERDLIIAEKIGGLTQAMDGMSCKLDEYCRRNEEQHMAMWNRIDEHSSRLSWIMGVGSAVTFVFSSLMVWIKHLLAR